MPWHSCDYYFYKLMANETKYIVKNRELLAIKLAFKEWRHWLAGAQCSFLDMNQGDIILKYKSKNNCVDVQFRAYTVTAGI